MPASMPVSAPTADSIWVTAGRQRAAFQLALEQGGEHHERLCRLAQVVARRREESRLGGIGTVCLRQRLAQLLLDVLAPPYVLDDRDQVIRPGIGRGEPTTR